VYWARSKAVEAQYKLVPFCSSPFVRLQFVDTRIVAFGVAESYCYECIAHCPVSRSAIDVELVLELQLA
jgi:hypothetical protein